MPLRSSSRFFMLALASACFACRSTPSDASSSVDASKKYSLDVTEATLQETLTAYRSATGSDLGVPSYVDHQTSCLRFALHVQSDSLAEVDRALTSAFRDQGLVIADRAGSRRVERDRSAPRPCAGPVSSSAVPVARSTPDPSEEELTMEVEKVSEDHVRVPRSFMKDISVLGRFARLTPPGVGPGAGLTLFGVHPGGVFEALGFQNGDNVVTVNGRRVGQPEEALEAYANSRNIDHLEVLVERQDRSLNLVIDVIPDTPRAGSSASTVPSATPSSSAP